MNKKTLYQIQVLQSKIKQYNDSINILKESRLSFENLNFSSNIDISLNLYSSSNIIDLQNKYTNIEDNKNLLKHNISKFKNEYKNNNYKLEKLDEIYKNKFIEEDNIFKEEIIRIESQNFDVQQHFKNAIDIAKLDKIQLYNDIELLKNELTIQNDIILQIQLTSHSSRKNILEELYKQKKDNILSKQQICDCKNNEDFYYNQIQLLKNNILQLLDFKKLIIDSEYNIEYNKDKLINYYNEFEEYKIDTYLYVNDKIAQIDKIIEDIQNKLLSINKKYDIHKTSNNNKIKDIIDNYNKKNKIKVIGYKDQYKIEKQKRDNIKYILEDLNNKYNTFENTIIVDIKNKLLNDINEIENDKLRTTERLNITKQRITEDLNNNKLKLNNLIDSNKLDLFNLSKEYNNLIVELDNIKLIIENANITNNKITKIDNEIFKYQELIQQMQKDLDNINNNNNSNTSSTI